MSKLIIVSLSDEGQCHIIAANVRLGSTFYDYNISEKGEEQKLEIKKLQVETLTVFYLVVPRSSLQLCAPVQ